MEPLSPPCGSGKVPDSLKAIRAASRLNIKCDRGVALNLREVDRETMESVQCQAALFQGGRSDGAGYDAVSVEVSALFQTHPTRTRCNVSIAFVEVLSLMTLALCEGAPG